MATAFTIQKILTYSLQKKWHAAQVMVVVNIAVIMVNIKVLLKYQTKNLVSHVLNAVMATQQAIMRLAARIMTVLDVHGISLNFAYDR